MLLESGKTTILLKSIEGTPSEDWPASPAIQECSLESRATGDVALLVGMAGKSFWSLSVHFEAGGIVFDAACRHQSPPEFIGSRYEVIAPGCVLYENNVGEPIALQPGEIAVSPAEPIESAGVIRWKYRFALS